MEKQTKFTLPTAGQKKPLMADTQPDMPLMETPVRMNIVASWIAKHLFYKSSNPPQLLHRRKDHGLYQ